MSGHPHVEAELREREMACHDPNYDAYTASVPLSVGIMRILLLIAVVWVTAWLLFWWVSVS